MIIKALKKIKNTPKADNALTFKQDHPIGACQGQLNSVVDGRSADQLEAAALIALGALIGSRFNGIQLSMLKSAYFCGLVPGLPVYRGSSSGQLMSCSFAGS